MAERPAGSIYDLGYRRYEGVRLGRRHAILALYIHGLRSAFGIGRRTQSKLFPIGLALLAFIPATIQLGIAAIAADRIEIVKAEDYYGYVEMILALFAAAVAPELVGRDQRTRTLSLYFSRAVARRDYAAARLGALITVMLALTLLPQTVLFAGRGLASNDLPSFFRDEADQIAPIVVTAVLISVLVAAVGVAVAAQTPRRVYATVTILAMFVVPLAIASAIVNITDGEGTGFALLLSPFHLMDGLTKWVFSVTPEPMSDLAIAGLGGWLYGVGVAAWVAACVWFFVRRIDRVAA
ncbi:MAG: ABC transporter permease subunit [Chloroflexi bacterium]|nr:ABC transporter permease subunit [Chloroflexota bacterium]